MLETKASLMKLSKTLKETNVMLKDALNAKLRYEAIISGILSKTQT